MSVSLSHASFFSVLPTPVPSLEQQVGLCPNFVLCNEARITVTAPHPLQIEKKGWWIALSKLSKLIAGGDHFPSCPWYQNCRHSLIRKVRGLQVLSAHLQPFSKIFVCTFRSPLCSTRPCSTTHQCSFSTQRARAASAGENSLFSVYELVVKWAKQWCSSREDVKISRSWGPKLL